MPVISKFFGILIQMYFDDHNPPHFYVEYAEYEALVNINDGSIVEGKLPRTAAKLVDEWRKLHINELLQNWELAKNLKLPKKIEPLE